MKWIPNLINTNIVYWEPPLRDGLGGYTWAAGVQIIGRWQDKELLFYDRSGTEQVASSIVWVNVFLKEGGYLLRGTLGEVGPDFDQLALQIVKREEMKSLLRYEISGYKRVFVK
jgi:hypothetical protein